MPTHLNHRTLLMPALWLMLVVVALVIAWFVRPTPRPAVTGRWMATDRTPVPDAFEVLVFPATPDVPIYRDPTGDRVVAHLNRAIVADLHELQQTRLSVLLAVDVYGYVDRTQLTLDPTGREDAVAATNEFLREAHPAMTELRRVVLEPVPDGPAGSWSLTTDWGKHLRFGFYRRGASGDLADVEPISMLETQQPAADPDASLPPQVD